MLNISLIHDFFMIAVFSGGCGDNSSENDNDPGTVYPDQQNRYRGHSAVKCFVSGARRNGQPEEFAQGKKHNHRRDCADQGVGDFDFLIRDHHIKQDQRQNRKQTRNDSADKILRGDNVFRHIFPNSIKIAAQRQGGSEQQRPQSNDCPVKGDFGFNIAGFIDFENEVEAVFNGGQHEDSGDGDTDNAKGGQFGGGVNKVRKILADFLFDVGDKIAEDNLLKLFFGTFKNRKSRKNRQADGKKRNDGNQGGVTKRGGNPEDHVALNAAKQKNAKSAESSGPGVQTGREERKGFIKIHSTPVKKLFTNPVKFYKKQPE